MSTRWARGTLLGFACGMAVVCIGGRDRARAENPGGPPLPRASSAKDTYGEVRLGYYALSTSYRYQGEYNATYSPRTRALTVYGFADIDVEAVSNQMFAFEPDRFAGTFEAGLGRGGAAGPLNFFVRHLSPHDIDRSDRRQGSWELLGVRWNHPWKGNLLRLSAGGYIHRIAFDYRWDTQADIERRLGRFLGTTWSARLDLHGVVEGGARQGFLDYWVESSARLAPSVIVFLGTGQVHDIDVFAGKTDYPVEAGFHFQL